MDWASGEWTRPHSRKTCLPQHLLPPMQASVAMGPLRAHGCMHACMHVRAHIVVALCADGGGRLVWALQPVRTSWPRPRERPTRA
eukprot:13975-Chlamydomonas_euryale.AAC.1